MPMYFCLECHDLTEHLNVSRAAVKAGVMRTTMYRWIKRSLVHTIIHPSGRILVCTRALLTPGFAMFPAERGAALPWTPDPAVRA